jgi:hypothetical protein
MCRLQQPPEGIFAKTASHPPGYGYHGDRIEMSISNAETRLVAPVQVADKRPFAGSSGVAIRAWLRLAHVSPEYAARPYWESII